MNTKLINYYYEREQKENVERNDIKLKELIEIGHEKWNKK